MASRANISAYFQASATNASFPIMVYKNRGVAVPLKPNLVEYALRIKQNAIINIAMVVDVSLETVVFNALKHIAHIGLFDPNYQPPTPGEGGDYGEGEDGGMDIVKILALIGSALAAVSMAITFFLILFS